MRSIQKSVLDIPEDDIIPLAEYVRAQQAIEGLRTRIEQYARLARKL